MTREEIKEMLKQAHHSTFRNEKQIKSSDVCGCYFCERIYKPSKVKDWVDNNGEGDPTATCPYCMIDSVLGNASGLQITPSLMRVMSMMFFGGGIDNANIKVNKEAEGGILVTLEP